MLVALGLFKMQIVIPIALLFLLWRRWRFFAGFALSAGLLSLDIPVGRRICANRCLCSLTPFGGHKHAAAADQFPLRVSIMANLRGLFFGLLTARLPAFWIQAVTIVASVSVLFWVARIRTAQLQRQSGRVRPRHHSQPDCELLPVHPRLECVADSDRCNAGPIHPRPAETAGHGA